MKTRLDEALRMIQKSGKTVDEKKSMCIKLGLRPRDVEYLEFQGFFRGVELTFGVEIECDVNRGRVEGAALPGFAFAYEGYNHTDNRTYFKFVRDGSVRGDDPIECVSPILDNNDTGLATLKACCDTLNAAGARVNVSCGLHVHVGAQGLKGYQIVNVYKNYQAMEGLIDSFMSPSRRGDCRWAKSLSGFNFNHCDNAEDVASALSYDRYRKVNPMSFERHGTIEFRQHQGTTDFEKISMWVSFCCELVEWSRDNVLSGQVSRVEDIPFLDEPEKAFFKARKAYFDNLQSR